MEQGSIDFTEFEPGGVAVVVGAQGGLGRALCERLQAVAAFDEIVGFARAGAAAGAEALDVEDEASIAGAVARLAGRLAGRELRLVIDATGFLHGGGLMPEKGWKDLTPAGLAKNFAVNAAGPALLMKHFLPVFPKHGRAVFASLSARVGSIGDNRLGGWYSYRAAKAALNQLVHCAAIELGRSRPEAVCVVLHPGTVASGLSAPFAKSGLEVRVPEVAAAQLLAVISQLKPAQSGGFFDYKGEVVPW